MNRPSLALAAALVVSAGAVASACGGPTPVATPTPGVDAAPATDAAPPAEDPREVLLRVTLEKARIIQDEVAALRELKFSHPVPARRQTVADFRKTLAAEVDKVFPAAESTRTSKALFHLGVLKERSDLATAMIELSVGQVAAYYNPETGTFYAVTLSDNQEWLDIMTAHELVHGLQDQNFDLRHYVGEPSPAHPERTELSEDQLNARRFVVEGEASLMMFVYKVTKDRGALAVDIDVMAQTRTVISMMGAMSWQAMVRQADREAEAASEKKAAKLSSLPPFLIAPTFESYTTGARMVFVVHQAGGWPAVNALYSDPPESTEQVLHPVEKLVDKRDHPTAVTLPDLSRRFGAALASETLGELGWRVYLETWDVPGAGLAAAGWDGDRLAVYDTPDGLVGLVAFVWDSEDDAIEFESAFRRSARARTNTGTAGTAGDGKPLARYRRGDGTEILVARVVDKIYIVDGALGDRADTLMTTLQADTTFVTKN